MPKILPLLPFLSLFLLHQTASAQNKAAYDLDPQSFSKQSTTTSFQYAFAGNSVMEYTLTSQGYFTLGTNSGADPGPLDDKCQITYGHPYARTSYPVLQYGGTWFRADQFFTPGEMELRSSADSLIVTMTRENRLRLRVEMTAWEPARSVTVSVAVENLDADPHTVGLGLTIDPALGKWGDGSARIPGGTIRTDTSINDPAVTRSIQVYEYSATPSGMGISLTSTGEAPGILTAENWNQTVKNPGPDFSPSGLAALYDLVLKYFWQSRTLRPGETFRVGLRISLLQPDFGDRVFIRCDLPQALTTENNLLYPRTIKSLVTVQNVLTAPQSGLQLAYASPDPIRQTAVSTPFGIDGHGTSYVNALFETRELYEDAAVPVTITCSSGGVPLAAVTRWVFIPSVPLSDTGLAVTMDTLRIGAPTVEMVFHAQIQSTKALLTGLADENIRLEENGSKIRQFTLGKDGSNGADAVDIVFALDVTGSMANTISAVKNNIREFADSLQKRGINYRLGMVTFLDDVENMYPFTSDVSVFQGYVNAQYAHGGGDAPENSLEALKRAAAYPFRSAGNRIILWITDITYHERDNVTSLSRQDVIQLLLAAGTRVHSVGTSTYRTDFYDPIITPTGGSFYDISGKFRDVLMDISRGSSNSRYLLSYNSTLAPSDKRKIVLTIHYAGLGGSAMFQTGTPPDGTVGSSVSCYPNPFNPTTRIRVQNPSLCQGSVEIFTLLGQKVKSFMIDGGRSSTELVWDARNEEGAPVATGCYLVLTTLRSAEGTVRSSETMRLIHLK